MRVHEVIKHADYEEMTRVVHILPHVEDHYPTDEKYYLWSNLCEYLDSESLSAADLQPKTQLYDDTFKQQFHYAIVGTTNDMFC